MYISETYKTMKNNSLYIIFINVYNFCNFKVKHICIINTIYTNISSNFNKNKLIHGKLKKY